jgi:hypothetical protein
MRPKGSLYFFQSLKMLTPCSLFNPERRKCNRLHNKLYSERSIRVKFFC